MTITATTTVRNTAAAHTTTEGRPALWRPALAAGLAAAAATTAMAAVLGAVGVSFEIDGETIPLLGFANLTLMCVAAGYFLAVALRRFASNPRRTFVISTVVLTVASLIPDVIVQMPIGARFSLMAMHVVAAYIVIPAVAGRLPEQRR